MLINLKKLFSKKEQELNICEKIISQMEPIKRDRFRKRYEQALQNGNAKCADCGLVTGVFNITLHKVIDSGKEKKVCQICLKRYEKNPCK